MRVLLFAKARDLAGASVIQVALPPSATVAALRRELGLQCPPLAAVAAGLLISVNSKYASESTPLESSAEIACFPPVSGG